MTLEKFLKTTAEEMHIIDFSLRVYTLSSGETAFYIVPNGTSIVKDFAVKENQVEQINTFRSTK